MGIEADKNYYYEDVSSQLEVIVLNWKYII